MPKKLTYVLLENEEWQNVVQLIQDLALGEIEEECRIDHHGYCQTHDWHSELDKCPISRAKEFLEGIDNEQTNA